AEEALDAVSLVANRLTAAWIGFFAGDRERGDAALREALDAAQTFAGSPDWMPAPVGFGWIVTARPGGCGRWHALEETFMQFRDVPAAAALGYVLAAQVHVARDAGDLDGTGDRLRHALTRMQEAGDLLGEGQVLNQLGNLVLARGEHREARVYL